MVPLFREMRSRQETETGITFAVSFSFSSSSLNCKDRLKCIKYQDQELT